MKKLIYILIFTIFANALDVSSLYNKSYNYEKIGRYKEAIKVLMPLYKKYPKGYTLNLRLGWLFYLNGKFQDSIKYYKKATLISPYSLEPRLGLTRVYLTMQKYKDAQMMAYEILKRDYYNYYGNLYAIESLIAQKKYNDAKAIASKMITIYPTNIDFLVELAKIYKATNDKNFKNLAKGILILDPNNVYIKSIYFQKSK